MFVAAYFLRYHREIIGYKRSSLRVHGCMRVWCKNSAHKNSIIKLRNSCHNTSITLQQCAVSKFGACNVCPWKQKIKNIAFFARTSQCGKPVEFGFILLNEKAELFPQRVKSECYLWACWHLVLPEWPEWSDHKGTALSAGVIAPWTHLRSDRSKTVPRELEFT